MCSAENRKQKRRISSCRAVSRYPAERYEDDWHGVKLADFITARVLELCYTAHDLKGFAADLGNTGPPFAWDDERRLHLRCQIDALFFHLYGLTEAEAGEILDTFPIVKRRTKRDTAASSAPAT